MAKSSSSNIAAGPVAKTSPALMPPIDPEHEDYCVTLLQHLVQTRTENFDDGKTQESKAVDLILHELEKLGIKNKFEIETLYKDSEARKNVIIRWAGKNQPASRNNALIINSHLDVVPASDETTGKPGSGWTLGDPFAASITKDGYMVGRGTADMKDMAAYAVTILRMLAEKDIRFENRDVVFIGVADEESGQDAGSKWLLENHPDKALGSIVFSEAGACTESFGKNIAFYPISFGEKVPIETKFTFKVASTEHASMPDYKSNLIVKAGDVAKVLGDNRLRYRISPLTKQVILDTAAVLPFPQGTIVAQLANGDQLFAYSLLDNVLPPDAAKIFSALLCNTCTPTKLNAGDKVNVLPDEVVLECDMRVLPGSTPKEALDDVKALLVAHNVWDEELFTVTTREDINAPEYSPEVMKSSYYPKEMYDVLKSIMESNGASPCVPFAVPGTTDLSHYRQNPLRTPICVGFQPMKLPGDADQDVNQFHVVNERVPVSGLKWGLNVMWQAVNKLGNMSDEELGVPPLKNPASAATKSKPADDDDWLLHCW